MSGQTRVLVVDDSTVMRQMIALTLRSAGYDVAEAADGRAALAAAQQQAFRVMLVDVNMPHMDGLSLVRALRGLPEYRYIPLLILTTEISADKRAQAQQAGATGWLVKPFLPDQLIATVRRLLA